MRQSHGGGEKLFVDYAGDGTGGHQQIRRRVLTCANIRCRIRPPQQRAAVDLARREAARGRLQRMGLGASAVRRGFRQCPRRGFAGAIACGDRNRARRSGRRDRLNTHRDSPRSIQENGIGPAKRHRGYCPCGRFHWLCDRPRDARSSPAGAMRTSSPRSSRTSRPPVARSSRGASTPARRTTSPLFCVWPTRTPPQRRLGCLSGPSNFPSVRSRRSRSRHLTVLLILPPRQDRLADRCRLKAASSGQVQPTLKANILDTLCHQNDDEPGKD